MGYGIDDLKVYFCMFVVSEYRHLTLQLFEYERDTFRKFVAEEMYYGFIFYCLGKITKTNTRLSKNTRKILWDQTEVKVKSKLCYRFLFDSIPGLFHFTPR